MESGEVLLIGSTEFIKWNLQHGVVSLLERSFATIIPKASGFRLEVANAT
jgi:hypothetical protein